jgi:isoleucyl-tRNA synthetase
MPTYRPVDPKADFPALERQILEFWRQERIFERTLAAREGAPAWVFYEGPPTANNVPHVGHVEARTFKDVYPRYKTMTGHFVARKAGWDCHGIPVELEVEKRIGTRTKRDIEAFGVAEFNELCRQSVREYVDEWARLTERIGFWINLDEAYWTMDPQYMQSVWWALKTLYEKGYLYQDDKVTAYCPRCGTPLSDHEVAQGYTQVTDPSIYVRFPVVGGPRQDLVGASVVAWTTTPWTLVSNLGLAVAPDDEYALVERDGDRMIVARPLAEAVFGPDVEVAESMPGSALVGLRYSPPYENVNGNTHRVVAGDFVSMNEGTGVVHFSPAFGADDMEAARREGWPIFKPVDDEGKFTDLAGPEFVRGKFVKHADPEIIEDLASRGLLVRNEEIEHTYPLCWRCDTPLIYYARPAWYVRTTAAKDALLAANESVNWYPDNIKHGRYGDWLENNVDWALSRERYWGTPLPIWICSNGHETVVGSLAELSELAGRDLTGLDLHRPFIDEVDVACPSCGQPARRVPYLIDVWFDAGAMSYAQWSYRGEGSAGEEAFHRSYPADFIAEAIDQTRGWFYTLMAEGVLLFEENPYRNVVCLGHLVDKDGRKMSKRLGNVLDPWTVIDRSGADALRWFLIGSGSPWTQRRISVEAVDDVVRRFLLTLWNTYAFFVTYANIDRPDLAAAPPATERPPLDRWALSQLHETVGFVREAMDAYDATGATRRLTRFVDDLSNWYVRRARRRFWDPARGAATAAGDKVAAYATLHECLSTLARLLAPFIPFSPEELYRNLVSEQDPAAPPSVHLTDYPSADPSLRDPGLDEAMATARAIVSLGRTVRTDAKVRVRQPLSRAVLHVSGAGDRLQPVLDLIAEELNVKEVVFAESAEELVEWRVKPNFRVLGPRLGQRVQVVAAAMAADDGALAARLASGEAVTIDVPNEAPVTLSADDVELVQQTHAGWGVASDGAVTVALDLEPTEELRQEGMVREVIRAVQDLRKSAGLDVADRIVLGIAADPEVCAAIARFGQHLAQEVLAVDVRYEPLHESDGAEQLSLDGVTVGLSLRRA